MGLYLCVHAKGLIAAIHNAVKGSPVLNETTAKSCSSSHIVQNIWLTS